MANPEEFERQSPLDGKSSRVEPFRGGLPGIHEVQPAPPNGQPAPRATGSPLPMGGGGRAQEAGNRAAPPAGRSLTVPAAEDTGMQRAMSILKLALPFVQRLLPLLDGNIGAAVSNVLAPRTHAAPPVDLTPVHSHLSELQLQQADLRDQVNKQNASIKRVEDQLEMVREATDRNTLEQQELIQDLKSVGNKVNLFALLLFVMLIVSLVLDTVMFLHIKQVLP